MAKLYFYYSAMNAGKTTTLLQSAHNYRERGMRVLILTPRLDDRAGEGTVASRIGLSAQGIGFGREDDLEQRVRADIAAHGKLDCVLVDEAQFLTKTQAWQLSEVVDALRVPVLLIGGDRDPSLEPMRVMHRKVRGSTLVVLSPASHFANRDQPEAWNRAAVEFLDRCDAGHRRGSRQQRRARGRRRRA